MRGALIAALLIALVVEGMFVASYLPTAREAVEEDGAYMLLLGTLVMFAALWLPTTRLKRRYLFTGILLGCSGFLLFLSYVFMLRW